MLRLIIFISTASFLLFILLFPAHAVLAFLGLISLPQNLPLGIHDREKLERNFQTQRPVLEAIVKIVRTEGIGTAKLKFLGLSGSALPPPQRENYQHLYRSMRQARVQKVEVLDRNPLVIRLVTDEVAAMIDTNVYGYLYAADDTSGYDSYAKLDKSWYLFEIIQ